MFTLMLEQSVTQARLEHLTWVLTMKDSWYVAQENLNWLQFQS